MAKETDRIKYGYKSYFIYPDKFNRVIDAYSDQPEVLYEMITKSLQAYQKGGRNEASAAIEEAYQRGVTEGYIKEAPKAEAKPNVDEFKFDDEE